MNRSFAATLIFVLFSQALLAEDNLDVLERRLNIIADFADRICNNIPTEGEGESLRLTGDADVELDSLIAKLVDAGVEGAVDYQKDSFKSVLRTDLLEAIRVTSGCKERVIDRFDEQFSQDSGSSVVLATAGSPCKTVSGSSKECLSGYCLPGPHKNVGGSEVNYCISAVKHCALPGGDGAMYRSTYRFNGLTLTCLNPNDYGYSGKWAQFFQP